MTWNFDFRKDFQKLEILTLFLVVVTLPLPFDNLISRVIIAYVIFGLIKFFYFKLKVKKIPYLFYLLIGLYLVHLIPYFTSEIFRPVNFDLEKKASILAFAIIPGLLLPYNKKILDRLLLLFLLTTTILALITFKDGFQVAWNNVEMQENLIIHRPYFGIYCIFNFLISISFILNRNYRTVFKAIILLTGLFNVVFIFIILAKMAIISLGIIILCLIGYFFWINNSSKVLVGYTAILISITIYLGAINPYISKAVKTVLSGNELSWEEYDSRLVNSLNLRVLKWNCSKKVLKNNYHWLVGAGTGDTQSLIDKCYKETLGENHFFLEHSYNPHNMYLTIWLNTGLTGLLLLLLILGWGLVFSLKRKNLLFFGFMLLIILSGATESILDVQKGVVFFAFFFSIFSLNQQN